MPHFLIITLPVRAFVSKSVFGRKEEDSFDERSRPILLCFIPQADVVGSTSLDLRMLYWRMSVCVYVRQF